MAWDNDKATGDEVTSTEWDNHVSDQKNHNTRHEDGGSDELDVSGLSGVLADAQTPQTEAVEDIVGGLLTGGTNIGLTYDDPNDTLTIDTTALDQEEVEDAVAALVTAGNAITVNYDDPNDTLTVGVNESALSFYDGTNLTADVDNQSVSTDALHTESRDADVVVRLLDDGTAVADGDDGEIASGSDIVSVIESAMAALTSGRDWKERVVIKGAGEISSAITQLPDYTILDATAAQITQADGANSGLLQPVGANHSEIVGGVWDGNGDNQTGDDQLFEFDDCHDILFARTVVKNAYRDGYIITGNSTDIRFNHAVARENHGDGFNPLDCDGVTFVGCLAEGQTGEYGASDGFHWSDGSKNITAVNCISRGNDGHAYYARTDGLTAKNLISKNNESPLYVHHLADVVKVDGLISEGDRQGIRFGADGAGPVEDSKLANIEIDGISAQWGLRVHESATGTVLEDISIIVADGETIDWSGYRIDADDVTARNLRFSGSATRDGIRVDSGSVDVDLRDIDPDEVDNGINLNNGVRPRWEGVIHGGPFGGVDLSTVTGQFDGDKALSDGTSASAAYLEAVWTGSAWQPFDGGATV